MTITFKDSFFSAHSIIDENDKLKRAGFKWDVDKKKWMSTDFRCAETLISYCDSLAVFQIRYVRENLQKAVQKSASAEGSGTIPLYHQPNMIPYPYQQAGVEYMLPRPAVILADQMGLGKAQSINCKIHTPIGWVKMGDIKVGDIIYAANEEETSVIGVYPQGEKDIFRIITEDGRKTECCKEHLWKTKDGIFELKDLMFNKELFFIPKFPLGTGWIKVISVDYVGKKEAKCIAIDHPSHLYVTDDFIVTHNTAQALITVNMRHPVEAIIVCPSILKYNWLKEARKWMIGHITVYIYESTKIRYYKARMTKHDKNTTLHIINYDILEKFRDRLMATPFNFFIADECFVYDTLVETNIGSLKIGDIIDNRLPVKILSYNHLTGNCEYKPISRYIKHEKESKKLIKLNLSNGKFLICTEEHKIYVNDGYKKASEVKSGDNLFELPREGYEGQERESDSEVLFGELCIEVQQQSSIRKSEKDIKSKTDNSYDLPVVWGGLQVFEKVGRKDEEILFNELFSEVENEPTVNPTINEETLGRQRKIDCNCKKEVSTRSESIGIVIKKNDREKSYDESCFYRKNETKEYWKGFRVKGRERKNDNSSTNVMGGIEFTRKLPGIPNSDQRSTYFVPIDSNFLQGGYSDFGNKISDRGRWSESQTEKIKNFRRKENESLECVRVESIEVLERGDIDRYRSGESQNINLYDIEVEDNHNYFASEVLVSNCHYIKNADSRRSKISVELAKKAKWKIFITGTPIYNKPKDLFVTLNLIDPNMFGDKFQFEQRYCGAYKSKGVTKYAGATNADELNTILRANYMVRRLAKDVMKDLPERVKDVIVLSEGDLNVIVQKEKKAVEESKVEEAKLTSEIDNLRELAKTNEQYEAEYKERVKKLREIRFKNFGELSRIRKELAIKKTPYVVNFVKEILDNSEDPMSKIVVFGHHTEVLEKLFAELKKYKPVIITGKISDSQRQQSISLFSQKNDTRVFIGSMGAAGTGVDGLQNNCNIAVFAELDWTPSLVDQAESRLARIGQKNTVWVYHIVADESLDSKIIKMMMEKEAVAKDILDYRPEQMYTLLINDKE